jgi:hypothetical protein
MKIILLSIFLVFIFEKECWTDWLVHVRWSAERKGFWTIWKEGIEVVNEPDIITQYPEALGPYAKFGQYHSVEEVPQNVVYFDEYRVAGPDGSYLTVASSGEQPKSEKQISISMRGIIVNDFPVKFKQN